MSTKSGIQPSSRGYGQAKQRFLMLAFGVALTLGLNSVMAAPSTAPDKSDVGWSPVVKGLRARIYTLPSKQPEMDKTFDVWVEFQEMGLPTSLGVQHRAVVVRFSRPEMQINVTNDKGDALAVTNKSLSVAESVPVWDMVLPPGADVSFPVGQGGSLPHSAPGKTPPKGKLLSFDALSEWLIPSEGPTSKLAVTFEVTEDGSLPPPPSVPGAATPAGATDPATNTPPVDTGAPPIIGSGGRTPLPVGLGGDVAKSEQNVAAYNGWNGTLTLPPIDLPVQ